VKKANLHGELVASMRSTIDHVEGRDWHYDLLVASQVCNVLNRPINFIQQQYKSV